MARTEARAQRTLVPSESERHDRGQQRPSRHGHAPIFPKPRKGVCPRPKCLRHSLASRAWSDSPRASDSRLPTTKFKRTSPLLACIKQSATKLRGRVRGLAGVRTGALSIGVRTESPSGWVRSHSDCRALTSTGHGKSAPHRPLSSEHQARVSKCTSQCWRGPLPTEC